MIRKIEKKPKVALCRVCQGTGRVTGPDCRPAVCAQCEGSGRVTVRARMELDIRPYRAQRPTTPTNDFQPPKVRQR